MLTGNQILAEVEEGRISIDPFDPSHVNPNSYNVTLGPILKVYARFPLDTRKDNHTTTIKIPKVGYVLKPNRLYLGATVEETETRYHIPEIGGRSSTARLGITVHQTGGFGDLGFKGRWTLEIMVIHPVRIYAGDEVAQIWFWPPTGEISHRYDEVGRYYGDMEPMPSKMHMSKRLPRQLGGRCPTCGYDMSTCAPGAPCPNCT
jgi:deoxycytidine triphosphate deaminase